MILEFSITNTFSISEKQTISFEAVINDIETDAQHYVECGDKKILKLACIYGANAAGKTKMLKALHFYMDFMLRSFTKLEPNENIRVIPFKFNPDFQNNPSEFELILYLKEIEDRHYIRYDYNLQLTKKKVVYESLSYSPKGQKKLIFERSKDNKIKWGSDVTGAKKIIEDMARPNCSIISVGAQTQHPVLKFFYDNVYHSFKGMIHPLSSDDLSSYIFRKVEKDASFKKILTNLLSASDIGVINDIRVIAEDIPETVIRQLPVEVQEQIVKHKGKLRTLILNHSYNDNQELIELFLELFLEASDNSQLLFTTHNQDLLDSGLLRDDEVWFCYKTRNGNSVYNSITDYKGIRKQVSRKKLYNADKFGALPNININLLQELFDAEKNRKNTEQ